MSESQERKVDELAAYLAGLLRQLADGARTHIQAIMHQLAGS